MTDISLQNTFDVNHVKFFYCSGACNRKLEKGDSALRAIAEFCE